MESTIALSSNTLPPERSHHSWFPHKTQKIKQLTKPPYALSIRVIFFGGRLYNRITHRVSSGTIQTPRQLYIAIRTNDLYAHLLSSIPLSEAHVSSIKSGLYSQTLNTISTHNWINFSKIHPDDRCRRDRLWETGWHHHHLMKRDDW